MQGMRAPGFSTLKFLSNSTHDDSRYGKGHFVIPIILGSDETFQTNFSGDKNIWPLHVSVANIPARYRNTIKHAAWRLVALLPIRPKRAAKVKSQVDNEKTSALETVQMVLNRVLSDLHHLEGGIKIVCPDGKIRIGHPVLQTWIGKRIPLRVRLGHSNLILMISL